MFVDNASNQIWVADASDNRVVRYDVNDVTIKANTAAAGVLGQSGFITSASGKGATGMNNAFGVAVDPTTGKLFVADRNNNRVLRFTASGKLVNGGAAEAVLGQPSLDSVAANTGGISASTMNTPVRVFVDAAGRLWVSDYGNHRVLRFDNASAKATGSAANAVLGQPDFTTNSSGVDTAKMYRPTGLFVDGAGRLWVAERGNSRVLRFDNAAAKASGAKADAVLGQPDFKTSSTGLTASKMGEPFGVYVDAAGRLWVAEDANARALRFDNAAAKANGAAADGVLGEPDFTTSTGGTTRNRTSNVRGIWGDKLGRIFLVEEGNHRITVFNNAATLANGSNADNVIGQPDFTTSTLATPPTAGSFQYPNSMFIDEANNQIWVADAGNARILRFDVQLNTITGIREASPAQLPGQFALSQNYPNPFNPTTTITFSLKTTEHATVTVYNLLGQVVATLFNGVAAANEQYRLTFTAASLPSGVYLCTLRSESVHDTKKMVLMK
jgi:DNA-binding beta-propeller fold protein YncE